MWSASALQRHYTEDERPRWAMHNPVLDAQGHIVEGDGSPSSVETAVNSPDAAPSRAEGTWGERDAGGPVDQVMAMEDYEALRKELTSLSKTRSGKSQKSHKDTGRDLRRISSARSAARSEADQGTQGDIEHYETNATDVERGEDHEEDDFELDEFMREGHFEKRKDGASAKKVGVVYKNLCVSADVSLSHTVLLTHILQKRHRCRL